MIGVTEVGIAVTGLGCICAAGPTLPRTIESMMAGRRNLRTGEPDDERAPEAAGDPGDRASTRRLPVFALSASWLPDDYWTGPEVRRSGRLAIIACTEALGDAGFDADLLRERRVGVCLGTTVGSAMNNEQFYRAFREGRCPDMETIRAYLQANPADMVARHFGLVGPRQTVNNACSSGSVAIGEAASWIRAGICDAVLAGGSDFLCRVVCNGFASLRIADSHPCRPFDKDRQGLNLGEGAGMLLLESEASRRDRAAGPARVRARLCGYGNACDAYHISAPRPDGAGLRSAIQQALAQAGAQPADVAFVNAHGTGTVENDKVESLVIPEALPDTPFLSTKGYTGHTLGAAGGIEAAVSIAFLELGSIPASAGFVRPDPEARGAPVKERTEVRRPYALSDSVAFGGNNVALVFRREDM